MNFINYVSYRFKVRDVQITFIDLKMKKSYMYK